MKRGWTIGLSLLLATSLVAQTAAPDASTPKPKPKRRATPSTAAEMRQLKQALDAQQQQIQQLQNQVQQRDQALQQVQQQLNQLQSAATDAQSKAQAAAATGDQNTQAVNSLQTTVSDLKTNATNTAVTIQESQKKVNEMVEAPDKIHFRGVTIQPGGFIEAATVFRSHNENADVTSTFGGIPFSGVANSHLSEQRFTARQSRLAVMVDGKFRNIKATGYWEFDFLGAAPTANNNETNSFTPRQRHLWGNLDFPGGWSFMAGQSWSLFTNNKIGVDNRNADVFYPLTIEAQYNVGYTFARQMGVRLYKNWNNKVYAAVAVENASTILSSTLNPFTNNIYGFNTSTNALSPTANFLPNCCGQAAGVPGLTNGVSTDRAPDVVAKVAFEPGWGHYELKGVLRTFRDRVDNNNFVTAPKTNTTQGGGLGFGASLPIIPKKADFIIDAIGGAGLGRYGAGQGPDVTLRPDGGVVPIHSYQALFGLELHPAPKWDWYFYYGNEYYQRTSYDYSLAFSKTAGIVVTPAKPQPGLGFANTGLTSGGLIGNGYGSVFTDNSACGIENNSTSSSSSTDTATITALTAAKLGKCQAVTRDLYQGQVGFWYRLHKGREGTVQFGASYSYLNRRTWQDLNGIAPKAVENIVMASFRYYLP